MHKRRAYLIVSSIVLFVYCSILTFSKYAITQTLCLTVTFQPTVSTAAFYTPSGNAAVQAMALNDSQDGASAVTDATLTPVNGWNYLPLDIQSVAYGSIVETAPQPEDIPGFHFLGWSLDGITIVDLASYRVDSETVIFYALYEPDAPRYFTISYRVNGADVSSELVKEGAYASGPGDITVPEGYRLIGWSLDGKTETEPAKNIVTGDTVYEALLEELPKQDVAEEVPTEDVTDAEATPEETTEAATEGTTEEGMTQESTEGTEEKPAEETTEVTTAADTQEPVREETQTTVGTTEQAAESSEMTETTDVTETTDTTEQVSQPSSEQTSQEPAEPPADVVTGGAIEVVTPGAISGGGTASEQETTEASEAAETGEPVDTGQAELPHVESGTNEDTGTDARAGSNRVADETIQNTAESPPPDAEERRTGTQPTETQPSAADSGENGSDQSLSMETGQTDSTTETEGNAVVQSSDGETVQDATANGSAADGAEALNAESAGTGADAAGAAAADSPESMAGNAVEGNVSDAS